MRRLILTGLTSLVLASTYSFVYACDHSGKDTRSTISTQTKTIRTMVVGATSGCRVSDTARIMSFDIDVPGRTTPEFVHIEACEGQKPAPSAFRTAVTLGRALVTTVEAVVSTLLDAATAKTASLV